MCNSFTALECCESAVAAAGTAVLLCSETNRRSALRLRRAPGSQVPECRLLIMQPPCRLSKLAKRTAWEHGDIVAHFTHAPYIFSQIAMHKRSANSNGTLPRCVCFYDSGEFIQASPSKSRCAIALLWSAKPYGCAYLRHCRLFVCTHDYAVKHLMCRRCLCSAVGMSLHHQLPAWHACCRILSGSCKCGDTKEQSFLPNRLHYVSGTTFLNFSFQFNSVQSIQRPLCSGLTEYRP